MIKGTYQDGTALEAMDIGKATGQARLISKLFIDRRKKRRQNIDDEEMD